MRVDEAIMVGRDPHVVEFAQRCELPALRKAAHHGAIELKNLDCLLFQQRAAAVAREFAFARG
jgi:hypothetical protein